MYKILKNTVLLTAILVLMPAFASYRMNVPLEITQGSGLPNGSILFGDNTISPENGEETKNNCIFEDGTFVVYLDKDEDEYKAGDQFYWYKSQVIAWYSPSNGYTLPEGLSLGTIQKSHPENPDDILYSLCADHPESYPPMVIKGPDVLPVPQ